MTQETEKTLKTWVISIAAVLGSITGIYEAYVHIEKAMTETGKEIIKEHTLPVVKAEIKATVDSIFGSRSNSMSIGLRFFPDENRLKYIHTNGKTYRPFLDTQQDAYYFINESNLEEWCK